MSDPMRWSAPPEHALDPATKYEAVIETTMGSFTVQLFAEESPRAVNNFVFLAEQGYFAGNEFFRVIAPFVIQTGDPTNRGTGGPGYRWPDELPPPYSYEPGIVAMANAGANTNGSQFFVCTGPSAVQLDRTPNYTQFGRVSGGMDVVTEIAQGPVGVNPATGERSHPLEPASIVGVSIRRLPRQG